eukprot:gb/GECG01007302.1/.p1 GENE.gb/GECG01007302.1/~~gb/GECG01007302.1/.p1  ORF type:complete len:488 (+),score=41.96 gb/GECG01007302.1/:1-1464(+)
MMGMRLSAHNRTLRYPWTFIGRIRLNRWHRNFSNIQEKEPKTISSPRLSYGLEKLPDTKHVHNIKKREQHIPDARLKAPQPKVRGPVELLDADAHVAVISKPAGLLTIPGSYRSGLDCALYRLDELLQKQDHIPQYNDQPQHTHDSVQQDRLRRIFEAKLRALSPKSRKRKRRKAVLDGSYDENSLTPFPISVHRLDMSTSGVMVFARTKRAARLLSDQFAQRKVEKQYEAILDTRLVEMTQDSPILYQDSGEVYSPIGGEPWGDPFKSKPTRSFWQVLERGEGAVRVRFTPLTGRSHQLRLHSALPPPFGLKSPIFGDSIYPHPHPGPCTAVGILGRFPLSEWNDVFENSRSVISAMNTINGIYDEMFKGDLTVPSAALEEGPFPTLSSIANTFPFPRMKSCPFLSEDAIETFQRNQQKLANINVPFFTPRLLLHACSISFKENYLPRELSTEESALHPATNGKELKQLLKPLGERMKCYSSAAPF